MFYSNTRSVKDKTTELQFLTADSDIICLTETHFDCTMPNTNVSSLDHRTVFRRDRKIHGDGVLIGVGDQLNPKLVDMSMYKEKVIAVKVQPKTVICCYYRLQSLQRLQNKDIISIHLNQVETTKMKAEL